MGIFLAANAVNDLCLVIDGLNCVMPKVEFLAGNHDINSTLLSATGDHRIICTMSGPVPQKTFKDKELALVLRDMASMPGYSVVLVTGLPYFTLTGVDYEGIVSECPKDIPIGPRKPSGLKNSCSLSEKKKTRER